MYYLTDIDVDNNQMVITYVAGPFDTEDEARKHIPQYKSMGHKSGVSFCPTLKDFSFIKFKGF